MARRAHGIAQEIVERYDGDTAAIWTTAKSGDALYQRVSSLPGFGEDQVRVLHVLGSAAGSAPGVRGGSGRRAGR